MSALSPGQLAEMRERSDNAVAVGHNADAVIDRRDLLAALDHARDVGDRLGRALLDAEEGWRVAEAERDVARRDAQHLREGG